MSERDDDMMVEIDRLLDEARIATRQAPLPRELAARILADAAEIGADHAAKAQAARRSDPGGGILRTLAAALGGWQGGFALAASAAAGLWIGYADPAGIGLADGLSGSSSSTTAADVADGQTVLDTLIGGLDA